MKTGKIFIISGPSGSGKTTLLNRLRKKPGFRDNPVKIVTATTRAPRKGEKNGRDYSFISRGEFEKRLRNAEFVESQEVFGQLYGTPKKELIKVTNSARDALLCIDVRGAKAVRQRFPESSVLIFISAASMSSLKERLRRRSSETSYALRQRLMVAEEEIRHVRYYDYVIVNSVLAPAAEKLAAVITAERLRVSKERG